MNKVKLIGEIDSWGYTRYCLEYDLSQFPSEEPVMLEVDSLGGDVMEAISISNMLRERGNVTAHIVGFCASAATWLCYACDKVILNSDCAFLIHKCSSYVDAWGRMNADELDTLIASLQSEKKSNEAIDLIIAQKYINHSGGKLSLSQVLDLMKEARWMTPEEVLELGLVDEISEEKVLTKTNMASRLHVMNSMSDLPKLPERFLAQRENPTVMQSIKSTLTDIFGGSVAQAAPPEPVRPVDEEPIIDIKMNKTFTQINSLLQTEGLEENDGRIVMTAEQVDALNNRLAELDTMNEANATLTAECDSARSELSAAETVINSISDEIASLEGIEAKVNAIKDTLSKVTGATETHATLEGDGRADEVCLDPVNSMVAQYRK